MPTGRRMVTKSSGLRIPVIASSPLVTKCTCWYIRPIAGRLDDFQPAWLGASSSTRWPIISTRLIIDSAWLPANSLNLGQLSI